MTVDTVVVVGSGPNGLAAGVAMAQAGFRVVVHEAMDRIGGGTRTEELTSPGYLHDVCSAVHPMAVCSPFFRGLSLERHGVEWIHPPLLLAHPFDDGTAAVLERSTASTADWLGGADGAAYRRMMDPFVDDWETVLAEVLAPPIHWPRRPTLMARFARLGLRSALGLVSSRFEGDRARAFFAGIAAHTLLPLDKSPSAAFGLVLALAGHAGGWPIARGGSQRVADALSGIIRSHGGEIVTGSHVRSLSFLPDAAAIFLDLSPRGVLEVAGERLPNRYRRWLRRYRYAPGVFKIDWALAEPIPWTAPECRRAGTIHLGGSTQEIARSASAVWHSQPDEAPFVLLAQPSLFDDARSPEGRHTAWAYCHVPNGSSRDMTGAIEGQLERFAPGFRDVVLARSTMNTRELERQNPNLVGGDIGGGVQDLLQLVIRPAPRIDPYVTPADGLYICSASTPPGGGVHGMCGYNAAHSALRRLGYGA